MRKQIKVGLAAVVMLLSLLVGGAASAATATAIDADSTKPLEILADENGSLYAQVKIVNGSSLAIASWQRDKGVWKSSEEVFKDLERFEVCAFGEAKKAATDSQSPTLAESSQNFFDNFAKLSQSASCWMESEYLSYILKHGGIGEAMGKALTRIPLDKFGPGKHTVFLQNIASIKKDPSNCFSLNFGSLGNPCTLKLGRLQKIQLTIAEPSEDVSANASDTYSKNIASFFDQSIFSSSLAPVDFSYLSNPGKLLGPAASVGAVAVVFSVLIALPTTLLESSLEANHERVAGLLKRILPARRKKEGAEADGGESANV